MEQKWGTTIKNYTKEKGLSKKQKLYLKLINLKNRNLVGLVENQDLVFSIILLKFQYFQFS